VTHKVSLYSVILLFGIFAIFFVRFFFGVGFSSDVKWSQVYEYTVSLVQDNYVKPVPTEQVTYDALRGVCEARDPFSEFFPPKDFERFESDMQGVYGGVGLYMRPVEEDGLIRVIVPIFGGPAYKAGIKAGDVIFAVNGETVEGRSVEAVSLLIKGVPGTEVKLTIKRPGEQKNLDFTLVREQIHIESVQAARMLDKSPGTAYVMMGDFQETSPKQIEDRLTELRKQGMERLILDLRENGGGALEAALKIADMFLAGGNVVVIRFRNGEDEVHKAKAGETFENLPIAILIDGASASASEILAAAIQDNRRGPIVGTQSYGKGSVQQVFGIDVPEHRKAGAKITIAWFLSPLGRKISRGNEGEQYGVIPNYPVDIPKEKLPEVYKARQNEWIRFNTGVKPEGPGIEDADPQLLRAVEVLNSANAETGPTAPAKPEKAAAE